MGRLSLVLVAAALAARAGAAAQSGAEHPAEHGPTRPVEVLVVDEEERPVAGAAVTLVDLHDVYTSAPELWLGRADVGRVVTSDPEGLVRFSACASGGLVRASKDGRTGLLDFDHHALDGEHGSALARTLVLRESVEIAVRVVDGRGNAVSGVPVALRARSGAECSNFLGATSDEAGVARFADLRDVFEEGIVPSEVEIRVGLGLLLAEPVELRLPPGPVPTEALELVLPPTGSLDVELVGADGKVLPVDALVEIALARPPPVDADEAWRREYLPDRTDDRRILAFARAGRLALERVGPGLQLELEVSPSDGHRVVHARSAGPAVGERVVVPVALDPLRSLTATLLEPDGEPLASCELRASLWIEERDGGSAGIHRRPASDADGRFELPFEPEWPLDVRCRLELWTDAPDGRRLWNLGDPVVTTARPALDLRITAEGCRTEELLGVAEDRIVGLRPALRLQLVLEPPVALGEHEWLKVELESRAGAPWRRSFAPRFHDGRSAEARVHEPGPYAVRLAFLQQAIGDLRATELVLEPEVVGDVVDDDAPQRFTIPLGPGALGAIERARADPPPRSR